MWFTELIFSLGYVPFKMLTLVSLKEASNFNNNYALCVHFEQTQNSTLMQQPSIDILI